MRSEKNCVSRPVSRQRHSDTDKIRHFKAASPAKTRLLDLPGGERKSDVTFSRQYQRVTSEGNVTQLL